MFTHTSGRQKHHLTMLAFLAPFQGLPRFYFPFAFTIIHERGGPVSYRFGDPLSLNLREFGDPRIDLGTPLSIDVNGCTAIDPKD